MFDCIDALKTIIIFITMTSMCREHDGQFKRLRETPGFVHVNVKYIKYLIRFV